MDIIGKIKKKANIGLWGSVGAVILTAAFHLSPYTLRLSPFIQEQSRWMLIAGSILAVLAVSAVLLTIRKKIPALRQSEMTMEQKLDAYSKHIGSIYSTMLTVVIAVCLLAILSGQSVLLMLAMVATLTLFMAFPNIYRIKVELGMSNDEAKQLFGDKYIPDSEEE